MELVQVELTSYWQIGLTICFKMHIHFLVSSPTALKIKQEFLQGAAWNLSLSQPNPIPHWKRQNSCLSNAGMEAAAEQLWALLQSQQYRYWICATKIAAADPSMLV